MGSLLDVKTSRRVDLEPVHSIGRSERSSLTLNDPRVSMDHATIRWESAGWTIHDLGSMNGTLVDGQRLSGEARTLSEGAQIAFGAEEIAWTFDDARPPRARAYLRGGGAALVEADEGLLLPSSEDVVVTVGRTPGGWEAQYQGGDHIPVEDEQLIQVRSEWYKLCLPRAIQQTMPLRGIDGSRIADLNVTFRVGGAKMDRIGLIVKRGRSEEHLKPKSHFELLCVLARARRNDAHAGEPDHDCGWTHINELVTKVNSDEKYINVQIRRARADFSKLRVQDPMNVVERRPFTGFIRFGVRRSSEESC